MIGLGILFLVSPLFKIKVISFIELFIELIKLKLPIKVINDEITKIKATFYYYPRTNYKMINYK